MIGLKQTFNTTDMYTQRSQTRLQVAKEEFSSCIHTHDTEFKGFEFNFTRTCL